MLNIEQTDDGITFSFTYIDWDEFKVLDLIDTIKTVVPKDMRTFEPEIGSWWVDKSYTHVVRQLFTAYGLE